MNDEISYRNYYARTIKSHLSGLKLVLGGTGLGKTSVIPRLVKEEVPAGKKSIYIANRIQLLDEMNTKFRPDEVIFLKRDVEVVLDTLKFRRTALFTLLDDDNFRELARQVKEVDLVAVRKACEILEQLVRAGEEIRRIEAVERSIENEARRILGAFRRLLEGTKSLHWRNYLLDHPVIQSLFPFIAFERRGEARLLLVTLQKAFHGFFNGQKKLNLNDLAGYIIFLDEFDFLENELIKLICSSPEVSDIFRFVELFSQEMLRHKLPLPTYPDQGGILRKRIEYITKMIKSLEKNGINFPEINQFTSLVKKRNVAIFRTSHIISSEELFLKKTGRAFQIVEKRTGQDCFRATRLFRVVGQAAEQILSLLKELGIKDPIVAEEIKQQCYKGTVFEEQLEEVMYPPEQRQGNLRSQLDALLKHGYNLFDIQHLQQRTDQEEVELRNFSIYTTPESILAGLVSRNLVFALSATADIPRCVNHFNLNWLRYTEGINFIELDEFDAEIIRKLNSEKAAKRQTELLVVELTKLDEVDPFQRALQGFINNVAKDEDFGRGEDSKQGHRRQRVEKFFHSLIWAASPAGKTAGKSHLMFLNSFAQLKFVFDHYASLAANLFKVSRREDNNWFEVYDLGFMEQNFTIVFYDAEQTRRIRRQNPAQAAFDRLFQEDRTVVIITQYLSAGNGVNLQYHPIPGSDTESDFLNLHLLEVPYFYFGNPEKEMTVAERTSVLKENIWYQAKLYTEKLIGEERFRQVLGTLHASHDWNNRYLNDTITGGDALLNNMATFIQAIGRIERTWSVTPRQTLLLGPEVAAVFELFLSEEFDYIRGNRQEIISNNLKQVLLQIEKRLPIRERELRQQKDERLVRINRNCATKIQELANQLKKVRAGTGDATVRRKWQDLRQAILRHDFQDRLLKEYSCIFETPLVQNNVVWLDDNNAVIPGRLANSILHYRWELDTVYEVVARNEVINRFFASRGYEMSFNPVSSRFFTPYCYQAILAGAVGEEATTALLKAEKINLEKISDKLFEVTDLKIAGVPIYIDCKNYTDATMERFALLADDPQWHPKLNETHFKERTLEKLAVIKAAEGMGSKLVYLVLTSYHSRPFDYYNSSFEPVTSLKEAEIVVVQGCLERHNPNRYLPGFRSFLEDLKSYLENELQERSN